MNLEPLNAISPVDGRYRTNTEELAQYFSEAGLIKYRVVVEIEYFIALCDIPLPQLAHFYKKYYTTLREIYTNFQTIDAQRVKDIERTTNHDVKAVEYFLKEKFEVLGLSHEKEFIHFGLTSQDVNNTAIPLSIKDAIKQVYNPLLKQLLSVLNSYSNDWADVPMLAHTHGQPASPTRLGKEIMVFADRLTNQIKQFDALTFPAKFGGATGNFNAHHVAYPKIDWVAFGNNFVNQTLGLQRSQITTQIDHYDNLSALFDCMKRINTILIDFARDVWTYISMDYFKQAIVKNEVGSSAMPHKINPIDFENAEGNLGLANAIFEYMAAKLPISRLQRDLTDSTVIRNVGVPFAHTIVAFKSLLKGISKLVLNTEAINADLRKNWNVVAEAIQTILRREAYPNPYEKLKELTRTNQTINQQVISEFIDSLTISAEVKAELKEITPFNYTGIKLKL